MLECAEHEDSAHHRGALQQCALRPRQAVDACRDQLLQRVRDALCPGSRPFGEHPDRLLYEKRVALRLREHGLGVDRQLEVGAESLDEPRALLRAQRLELDRDLAAAAAAPARMAVEQLAARDADEQQRRLADAGREMLDQLEQRLLAPVDVLEHQDERLRLRELLRPRAGGPRDLLLAALAFDGLEHADGETEQVGDLLVFATGPELLLRLVERV